MNAFVFFAIFHSSDSYESPFLDQNFAKNQERKGETSPSTSINFPLSEVWRYQVAGVKTHFLISRDSWPQTWGTLAATMVGGGLVSSTLLKPMSTSAIVPVSCHKNYVTKYIYRCFFSNICIWPYLPWPIYFLSKKTRHLPTGGTPGANPWARNNHLSIGSGVPYQGPLSLFSHQLVPEGWHIDVTPEVSRGRIDGSEIKELNQPFDIENITMVHDFLHPQDEMFDIFQRFRSWSFTESPHWWKYIQPKKSQTVCLIGVFHFVMVPKIHTILPTKSPTFNPGFHISRWKIVQTTCTRQLFWIFQE